MPRVLIVEDDDSMARALRDGFEYEGYEVLVAQDGTSGLELAQAEEPDLVILDVMLPKLSGLDVCKEIRAAGNRVPILMLTARGQEIDKVLGLKLGADDYVTKPFGFLELAARVEAVLRRASPPAAPRPTCHRFADVVVDLERHEVCKSGRMLELSPREFRLLCHFIEHRGEVLGRDELLDAVWDYDDPPLTRTVDMHVAKLRRKLEDDPGVPRHIVTVHRLGYKFTG